MNPITILLAEDHAIIRDWLVALLKLEDDIEVVGEARNGHQAVAFASELCPEAAVMDITMPRLNGLVATLQIVQTEPSTKVLMLSTHADYAYVEQALALRAAGYVIRNSAANVFPKAIREVHNGRPFSVLPESAVLECR